MNKTNKEGKKLTAGERITEPYVSILWNSLETWTGNHNISAKDLVLIYVVPVYAASGSERSSGFWSCWFRGPGFRDILHNLRLLCSFCLFCGIHIGRDLMDTSHLGLGVLRSLSLCIMCVFISVSICYRKKYLWQRLSKTLNYVFTQKSTRVILLLRLFTCWTVVFFLTLDPCVT